MIKIIKWVVYVSHITILVHSRGDSLFVPIARDIAVNHIRLLFGQYCYVEESTPHLCMQHPFISHRPGHVYTLGMHPRFLMGVDSMKYKIYIPDREYHKHILVKGTNAILNSIFIEKRYWVNSISLDVKAEFSM